MRDEIAAFCATRCPRRYLDQIALMLTTVLSATTTTKKSLSRLHAALYSQMSQAQNVVSNSLQHHGIDRKPVIIPFSSRLRDGRALAQDVWSIFKYVPISVVCFAPLDAL